ncbi:MAG: PEGA domain-containing protein, partial [Gammaproteobacteria bacterium]|nr:PEGA domain-containing protein [Gammaproteobacteria bacterium]
PWTDISAMAGVIYRMISGSGPPEALNRVSGTALRPASEVARTQLSPALLEAVDRGLELDVANRPKSVEEFRALLLGREPEAVPAYTDSDATYVRKPAHTTPGQSRRPWWITGAIASLAVIAAVAFFIQDLLPTAVDSAVPPDESAATEEPSRSIDTPATRDVEPASPLPLYTLVINLTPADATVEVAGQTYTPGMQLPAGDYTLTARKSGYRSATKNISIDGDLTVALALAEAIYPFTISANPANARVRIRNIEQVYAPGLELPPGSYDVAVSAAGYEPWEGSVTHGTSATQREVKLSRLYSLTFNLNPDDATVELAGHDYTPGMRLVSGKYAVTIKKPGYESATESIVLDRDVVAAINLTPSLGVLTLILSPSDARVTLPDLQRRYTPGMRLPVGSVRVSVARDRYEPANREVMIRPGNNAIVFNLQRIR